MKRGGRRLPAPNKTRPGHRSASFQAGEPTARAGPLGFGRATSSATILFFALLLASLAALFWTCRGAPLGVPIADDYDFLYRLTFQKPLEWFDSMGATVYWRPLGRQLYFSLFGASIVSAPWISIAVHTVLLIALSWTLFLLVRGAMTSAAAIGIALFPLLGEPTRVLLGWPSGGQYLLGALLVSLAWLAAARKQSGLAALAAMGAAACHELGLVALASLPILSWRQRRNRAGWARASFPTLAAAVVYCAGYLLAISRGTRLSGEPGGLLHFEQIPAAYFKSLFAQLNLEGLGANPTVGLGIAYLALFVLAIILSRGTAARSRLRTMAPWILGGAAWFAIGTAAIALAPAWNAWRSFLPALGIAVALFAWLGAVSPALAIGFAGLRLVALLFASPALDVVSNAMPSTPTDLSHIKVARLQRTVESTRRVLTDRFESLEPNSQIRFTGLPHLTYFGFKGAQAIRVWYRDSTVDFRAFGGDEGFTAAAVVMYEERQPWPARLIEPRSIDWLGEARSRMGEGRLAEAESLLTLAINASLHSTTFRSIALTALAAVALERGALARADSLVRASIAFDGRWPDARYLAALVSLNRRDSEAAGRSVHECLSLKPDHPECLQLARQLEIKAP